MCVFSFISEINACALVTMRSLFQDDQQEHEPTVKGNGVETSRITTIATSNNLHGTERENIGKQYCSTTFSTEREAYAASTALMGESVFDSPNIPDAPPATIISRDADVSDPKSLSVGIMAQGLSWARRQRERRQRLYLQNQAEMQLRKIRKAQQLQAEKNAAKEQLMSRSLMDNPTFQNFMKLAAANVGLADQQDDSFKTNYDNSNASSGIRFFFSKRSSDTLDDDERLDHKISNSEAGGYSVEIPVDEDRIEEDVTFIPTVRIHQTERDLIETVAVPYILTADEMQQIAAHVLPRGIVYCPWQRLYSLARDGDSFESCMRAIGSEKQTLMVIRSSQNAVFGGFADTPWEHSVAGYIGGIHSCLFRVVQNPETMHSYETNSNKNDAENLAGWSVSPSPIPQDATTKIRPTIVKAYKWTGANRYIQLCDPVHKMIAFGGGGNDGAFGLCVQQDFLFGSSGSCATFDNEPLCGNNKNESNLFEIIDMEVWGFLIGQF